MRKYFIRIAAVLIMVTAYCTKQESSGPTLFEIIDSATNTNAICYTVTIRFGGDVMMTRRMSPHLTNGLNPFTYIAPILADCELSMVNLETTIGTNGTPEKNKTYTFMTAPYTLGFLTNAGVDFVCLGNNHTYDYGEEGLLSTLDYLDRYGILHSGAGTNDTHAKIPVIFETNGFKIGVISYGDVYPTRMYSSPTQSRIAKLEISDVSAAVIELREKVDYLIVNMHTGDEYVDDPTKRQKREARRYIDKGADLIVIHGPHVLQGLEFYESGMIYYSLGNLVFDQGFGLTIYTMIGEAQLEIEQNTNGWTIAPRFAVIPVMRSDTNYMDNPPTTNELTLITNRLITTSVGLSTSDITLTFDTELTNGFKRFIVDSIYTEPTVIKDLTNSVTTTIPHTNVNATNTDTTAISNTNTLSTSIETDFNDELTNTDLPVELSNVITAETNDSTNE